MNEMIERVARAIDKAMSDHYDPTPGQLARAAIEAMRDPTGWMALAGENVGINWLAEAKADMTVREARPLVTVEIYKGMINAALNFGATSSDVAKD